MEECIMTFKIPPSLSLSSFYQDLYKWITYKNASIPFESTEGLCENLRIWITHHDGTRGDHDYLQECLSDEFLDARRSSLYPFNSGDAKAFAHERENNLVYLNPSRLEWIHTHVTKTGLFS